MNLQDIPYDVSYSIDDSLKERANNPDAMQEAVVWLEARLADEQDTHEQMTLYSTIGALCRVLGRLDEAEAYINMAITASNHLRDRSAQLRNLIRLAQVYQCRQDYMLADRLYNQVIMACVTDPDATVRPFQNPFKNGLDFAYQHLGKSKFEQADYENAYRLFEKALAIRQLKRETELIESTQYAMEICKRFIPAETANS